MKPLALGISAIVAVAALANSKRLVAYLRGAVMRKRERVLTLIGGAHISRKVMFPTA